MSEFRDAIRDVISDRECGTAELCRNLKTGELFNGEYEDIQDAELNTALGRDAREQALLHVSDRVKASRILAQAFVSIQLFGRWTKFLVVRRKDNPGDPQVEFGLQKWTDKDQ